MKNTIIAVTLLLLSATASHAMWEHTNAKDSAVTHAVLLSSDVVVLDLTNLKIKVKYQEGRLRNGKFVPLGTSYFLCEDRAAAAAYDDTVTIDGQTIITSSHPAVTEKTDFTTVIGFLKAEAGLPGFTAKAERVLATLLGDDPATVETTP